MSAEACLQAQHGGGCGLDEPAALLQAALLQHAHHRHRVDLRAKPPQPASCARRCSSTAIADTHEELRSGLVADAVWHGHLQVRPRVRRQRSACRRASGRQGPHEDVLLHRNVLLPGALALELGPLHGHHALPLPELGAARSVLVHGGDACAQTPGASGVRAGHARTQRRHGLGCAFGARHCRQGRGPPACVAARVQASDARPAPSRGGCKRACGRQDDVWRPARASQDLDNHSGLPAAVQQPANLWGLLQHTARVNSAQRGA